MVPTTNRKKESSNWWFNEVHNIEQRPSIVVFHMTEAKSSLIMAKKESVEGWWRESLGLQLLSPSPSMEHQSQQQPLNRESKNKYNNAINDQFSFY